MILLLYLVSVFYFYAAFMVWTDTHGDIVPLLLPSVGAEKDEFALSVTGIFA
jgi:hypothetical protein